MAGNIKAERFLFESQRFLGGPFFNLRINVAGFLGSFGGSTEHGENVDLITFLISLKSLTGSHGLVQHSHHPRPGNSR